MNSAAELCYFAAAPLFILALRWMSSPETARRAVMSAVIGMGLAIGGTLLQPSIQTYTWIAIALVAGVVAGIPLSRVPLTAVPERTGLSQAFGGLAVALVGIAKYYLWLGEGLLTPFKMGVIGGEVILGCLTCTGGLLAAAKLAEMIPTRPITYRGQNIVSFLLLSLAVVLAGLLLQSATSVKLLPRMPLPTQGTPTSPFKYSDPDED